VELPFNPRHQGLYSREELWTGYDSVPQNNTSLDWKIYEYFNGKSKYAPGLEELSAQREHDAHIETAINAFFALDASAAPTSHKVLVTVGSHSTYRDDPVYKEAARLTWRLHREGYFIVSGGGPGLMEATHVGAWMARMDSDALEDALNMLAASSKPPAGTNLKQYEMPDYWQKSKDVVAKYANGAVSLGIPTWFYGHEGANAFSWWIGKYFSNALREEKICAIGQYGVIFLNGGPGTAQEAFVDAAENGYASYNWFSPMVFYQPKPLSSHTQALVTEFMQGKEYGNLGMVGSAQNPDEALAFLATHPPVNHNAHGFAKMFRRAD
jgi:predicted Rossmann-fold nucleotide-binding protein